MEMVLFESPNRKGLLHGPFPSKSRYSDAIVFLPVDGWGHKFPAPRGGLRGRRRQRGVALGVVWVESGPGSLFTQYSMFASCSA